MQKIKINEAIVVEGRDDTAAVKQAADCMIIETHGFGIRRETWQLIEKAYKEKGIIIFTDPDFSGEEIRRKLSVKFPEAKQAFLDRKSAEKKGDIGIENATPEAIAEALLKAHCTAAAAADADELFTEEELFEAGLAGDSSAKERREQMGKILGIGYGNAKSFLGKLNKFRISKEDFYEALRTIDNTRN